LSLANLSVDLAAVARFPATLLQKRCFLPFGWKDEALQVLVPPRCLTSIADEVAFAAGCPVLLFEAGDGNLPKLIQSALAALAEGRKRLGPSSAAEPLSSDLVYLEDLGSLGRGAASSLAASTSGPALMGDGISLGEALSSALRSANSPVGARAPAHPSAQAGAPATAQAPDRGGAPAKAPLQPTRSADLLPPVVDLDPDGDDDLSPPPRTLPKPPPPSPPPPPAAAKRTGREEELFEDPDGAELDLAVMPDLDLDGEADGQGPQAKILGRASADSDALARTLRGLGFGVSTGPWETDSLGGGADKGRGDAPVLLACSIRDPDSLGALRRRRNDESAAVNKQVVLLFVPWELQGWRLEADLQKTYGADLAIGPSVEPAILRRRLLGALRQKKLSDSGLKPWPGEAQAMELAKKAAERYLSNQLEEAVSLFEEALRADPSLASAQVGLAMARVKQQRPMDAICAFERALLVEPGLFSALRNLGILYEKRGFRHKAMDTFERALGTSLNPDQQMEILERLGALSAQEG
jgi:hypothetical protein